MAKVSGRALEWVHGVATVVWLLLAIPSLLFWKNSVPYLVFLSVYAIVAAHAAGWGGARAESAAEDDQSNG